MSRPAVMGRQFTLGQVMKATAVIAVLLAIAVQPPMAVALADAVTCAIILAPCLYGLSWLPYRVRLTIEVTTACSLLIVSAWVWRPPWYVHQAGRTEELARLCSLLADATDDAHSRDLFRREAAEYGRRARVLRLRAMWYGLLRSVTRENPVSMTGRELIEEISLSEARARHLEIARKMGMSLPAINGW